MTTPLELIDVSDPADVSDDDAAELTRCWVEVTNAGGAVGFPHPPVNVEQVAPATRRLVDSLGPRTALVLARDAGSIAGWVAIVGNAAPAVAHWATVHHLQVRPGHRGRGLGTTLMHRCRTSARGRMGLEQLRLSVRDGEGLEPFYARLGWRRVGRWPGGIRLAPDDTRDEVLFVLDPL